MCDSHFQDFQTCLSNSFLQFIFHDACDFLAAAAQSLFVAVGVNLLVFGFAFVAVMAEAEVEFGRYGKGTAERKLGHDACAEFGANIVDISQSVLSDYFAMIMLADIDSLTIEFSEFVDKLEDLGKANDLVIHTMHEDIFNTMHHI